MKLRIRDWNTHYENNRTRDLKHLEWVPMPNRMDGLGYLTLINHPNGAAHFGAWLAIVEIASRQSVRGAIPQEGASIPQALATISRLPAGLFTEVIPRLIDIGWLEQIQQLGEIRQEGAVIPQEGAPSRARDEGKGMELKGRELKTPDAPPGALSAPLKRRGNRTTDQIIIALGEERLSWWENCWRVYPCHEGKRPAMDAFERIVHSRDLAAQIFNAAKAYAAVIAADPTAKVKYFQGWLNDERWNDVLRPRGVKGPRRETVIVDPLPATTPERELEALRWIAENDEDETAREYARKKLAG